MAIQTPIVKINNYPKATGSGISGEMKNTKQINAPAFKGKQIEVKSKYILNKIKYLGDNFSSASQRLVSGVTALMTQPFFDLNNKHTDEKTRKVSCARTVAKIIAGTLTGVSIRWICIEATEIFCKTEITEKARLLKAKAKARLKKIPFTEKFETPTGYKKWLVPKNYEKATFREIKKYRGALGTFAAVIVMIGTNFLIDAPLTTYLTNKFNKMFFKKDAQKNVEGDK